MTLSLATLIADAGASVPKIGPADAHRLLADGALLLDVRDAPERTESGSIPGSVHVSRGMLEFRADPASPYYDARFDPHRAVVLYCASGGRSALAGKTLKDMGYTQVFNLGGLKDWLAAGEAVEHPSQAAA